MWKPCVGAALILWGCGACDSNRAAFPKVDPDTVVISWTVVGQESSRDTLYVSLRGNRQMEVVIKQPNGTILRTERELDATAYGALVTRIRTLDCCALESTSDTPPSAFESRPELGIDFGDLQCQISLWDSEWREGRARDCGFAVAEVHGRGFIPDPPAVDDRL